MNYKVVNEITQVDIECYARSITSMASRILDSEDFTTFEKKTIIRVGDLLQQVLRDWTRVEQLIQDEQTPKEPEEEEEEPEEEEKEEGFRW